MLGKRAWVPQKKRWGFPEKVLRGKMLPISGHIICEMYLSSLKMGRETMV